MSALILDIATYAIADVDGYIEEPSAPSNYKDPDKIAAYVRDKRLQLVADCALDPDLTRISAVGRIWEGATEPVIQLECDTPETRLLEGLADDIRRCSRLVGFHSLRFDWPVVMRRARYLGIEFPWINCDRYRSPHVDVSDLLSQHGTLPVHSLSFYVKRMGWTDLTKPLSGSEESRAPLEGKWDELRESVRHDVLATQRLAAWAGVIDPVAVAVSA